MLIMLAVNILLIDQLLCSLVWVISLGLNFKRSWHVIMNINIWQPQEERIKKQWAKLLINDLWFFMNFCTKYECKNGNFVKKSCSIFHFIVVFLRQNFAGQLVWWYLIFTRTGTDLVWTDARQSCALWDCHQNAVQFICCCLSVPIIHLNDLFIQLIVTKTHQLYNSVFSIEP